MKTAPQTKENQEIATTILKIVADYDKRVGAYKITHILERDYGIKISPGRVYQLIKTLNLPRMSTQKPVLKNIIRKITWNIIIICTKHSIRSLRTW